MFVNAKIYPMMHRGIPVAKDIKDGGTHSIIITLLLFWCKNEQRHYYLL